MRGFFLATFKGMKYGFLFTFLISLFSFAQEVRKDTSWNKRSWIVAGSNTLIGGGSVALISSVWYKEYPKSNFHLFNDSKEWLYMDKCGHLYTANKLSETEYAAWRWAGLPRKKAIWLSGGISWTYQFSVEVLDGFSSGWGFSIADLSANTLGSGLFIAQHLAWDEQRFQLKFGYKKSPYAALRPNALGSTAPERLLKDYNAQSYWLCVSPGAFGNENPIPEWLQIGFGYSINGKLNGDLNTFSVNGLTYHAQQEYAVSLDIDWSKLPIKRPWLKKLVKPLNAVKIPLPAVYWRNGLCYVGLF